MEHSQHAAHFLIYFCRQRSKVKRVWALGTKLRQLWQERSWCYWAALPQDRSSIIPWYKSWSKIDVNEQLLFIRSICILFYWFNKIYILPFLSWSKCPKWFTSPIVKCIISMCVLSITFQRLEISQAETHLILSINERLTESVFPWMLLYSCVMELWKKLCCFCSFYLSYVWGHLPVAGIRFP